jgi:hypothetical protein
LSEYGRERLNIQPKTVKINKDFIEDLTKIFEKEMYKIPEDERPELKFTVYLEGDEDFDPINLEKFKKSIQNKKVKGFRIMLDSLRKEIIVNVRDYSRECEFITNKYHDDTWAKGIKKEMGDLFEQYRTVRNKLPIVVFAILLGLATIYVLVVGISFMSGRKTDDPALVTAAISIGGNAIWGYYYFFSWLFPRNETEFMERIKFRKLIIGGIVSGLPLFIVAQIITSFLSR